MLQLKSWLSIVAIACVVSLGSAGVGRADLVVNFDDLPPPGGGPFAALTGAAVPNDYAGLQWSNFNYLNPAAWAGIPSGYLNVPGANQNVAINVGGEEAALSIASASAFTLLSVQLMSAWNNGMLVTMVGSLAGVEQFSTTQTVDMTGLSDFLNPYSSKAIDSLTFTASGGTLQGGLGGSGTIFLMDNLTLGSAVVDPPTDPGTGPPTDPGTGNGSDPAPNVDPAAVPEPASLASAALAVAAGLGLASRRRRAA